MGLYAQYMEISTEMLETFKNKSNDNIFEELEELQDDETFEICDIDKMWDGLHFLLTGVSAVYPIENDLLSGVIAGIEILSNKEDYEYISCIYPDKLKEIVKALDSIDTAELGKKFSPRWFAENDIYPDIWMYENEDELREDLLTAFEDLKEFYHTVVNNNNAVIIIIG